MKLIIQIPCYNEERTLPATIKAIPRKFDGIDIVELLVIDDGSTDRTVEKARELGVDHIVRLTSNRGLAVSFSAGLDSSLRFGADIIVNTDGDNQYRAEDIQKLIDPILAGSADMVVGDREVMQVEHFSFIKKLLQKLGSWVVRHISNTTVPDVTSGFRAFSREAALRMNVISQFTYTLDTIIQAGKKGIPIAHVSIRTNKPTRPSRLFKSIFAYINQSGATIARIYALYEPLKTFLYIGGFIFGVGFLVSMRFLYFFLTHQGEGHIQSLILSAVFMIVGFQVGMIGLLADIISANRRLIEEVLYRLKKSDIKGDK
ncbi:glycosyltransferase family 2 protein [bacterium]|nr:glycosyltransferase family 2 protein [bacterium]